MSARYAVIGAAGQLGSDLLDRLPGEVVALNRADLDLTDPASVRRQLSELRPQCVLNCAAYNFVDRAEDEPAIALAVNALGVRNVALVCTDIDALLVHFSTDYVFGLDANRRQPYRESDLPGPLSVYGHSKLCGEFFVRGICPRHLVIRTCGLYGRSGSGGKGTNFVETMLRLASQGRPLKVVADQVLTPTSTKDLARALVALLQAERQGLYHLTNQGECSWFEFAQAIFDLAGVKADLTSTTTREYGSKARRPAYSVLKSEHADAPVLPPWRDALAAYVSER